MHIYAYKSFKSTKLINSVWLCLFFCSDQSNVVICNIDSRPYLSFLNLPLINWMSSVAFILRMTFDKEFMSYWLNVELWCYIMVHTYCILIFFFNSYWSIVQPLLCLWILNLLCLLGISLGRIQFCLHLYCSPPCAKQSSQLPWFENRTQ